MLADFYITMLSNDMKIVAQKNHLGVNGTEVWSLLKDVNRRKFYIIILWGKIVPKVDSCVVYNI